MVSGDNRDLYEVGTGGIMRPAVLYVRTPRSNEEPAPDSSPEDVEPEKRPLFGGE